MDSWSFDEHLVYIWVTALTLNFANWLSKISKIMNLFKVDKNKQFFIIKWSEDLSHLCRKQAKGGN